MDIEGLKLIADAIELDLRSYDMIRSGYTANRFEKGCTLRGMATVLEIRLRCDIMILQAWNQARAIPIHLEYSDPDLLAKVKWFSIHGWLKGYDAERLYQP